LPYLPQIVGYGNPTYCGLAAHGHHEWHAWANHLNDGESWKAFRPDPGKIRTMMHTQNRKGRDDGW